MKTKSRFPEQAPSAVYAFVLHENTLIFGVKGVLAVSNEGKARDGRGGGWIN